MFVLQDVSSKYVTIYAIKRETTAICLKKIRENYTKEMGVPRAILSDHGTQFTSPAWKRGLQELGIKSLMSSIRHPQSNPAERTMRELGRLFRTYCHENHKLWASYIDLVRE